MVHCIHGYVYDGIVLGVLDTGKYRDVVNL